jgi:capsular polysaccharide biosynthesis protein
LQQLCVERITDIIDGAKMTTVQEAFADTTKVGPSITKYTAVGFLLGALVSMLIVAIIAIADDRIHDEDYILDNYNYPILAKIPDLVENDSKKYGYYYRSKNKTKNDVDSMAQK